MKKASLILSLLFTLLACNQSADRTKKLQDTVDSLQKELQQTYKPGLGEFMSGIQVHHAKLWFAAINNNWPLADFEVHEIKEALDDIRQYCKDRPEIKALEMIDAPLDSVVNSIGQRDINSFKSNFVSLTGSCNKCHQATEHGFNIVVIPSAPPVVNQDFKPASK